MRIGVDIRSLAEAQPGGVTGYTRDILRHLLKIDQKNEYVLFSNSWARPKFKITGENVQTVVARWPNKLFNSSLALLNQPKLDKMVKPIDLFFVPNLNFVSFSENCPVVMTFHDLSFELYPEFLSRKRRLWHKCVAPKRLARQAQRIVAVSESTKNDLIDLYGLNSDKIDVVYSGVSDEWADAISGQEVEQAKESLEINQPYILSVSFLEPRKNIAALLRAFDQLKSRFHTPHQLIIVGHTSWDQKNLESIQKGLDHKDSIRFVGYLDVKQKNALLKGAEVFVYPSVYEGFGFPPLESILAGTPVIASAASSLPEVLGESAIYVQPYNVSELTQALSSLINEPELKAKLLNKRDLLKSKYSWEKAARETLKVFEKVIS